jgi:alpha/beta superfamily hydrolase
MAAHRHMLMMDKKQVRLSSKRPPPPQECDNYPPILSIKHVIAPQLDYSFFIDCEDGCESIACSFICIDHENAGTVSPSTSQFVDLVSFIQQKKTPIIIVCHGLLSWRNQMLILHLAANLSKKLHCNSLRFDFVGNAHSSGTWRFASYDQDYYSLAAVVSFVQNVLQTPILCIVGHSRATCAVMKLACSDEGKSIPYIVNLSGRFNARSSDSIMTTHQQKQDMQKKGKFELMRRGSLSYMVTAADLGECSSYDMSSINYGQINAKVLTIHGDCDRNVSVDNAFCFEKALGIKHTLKIIEGADHNFNGMKYMSALVNTISSLIQRFDKDTKYS